MIRMLWPPLVFEWVSAVALAAIGVHMILFPHSVESGRFAHILSLVSPQVLTAACLVVGFLRCGLLLCNVGPWCPRARAFCAMISSCMWAEFAIALSMSPLPGSPSIGIPVYLSLAGGELFAVWRARIEVNGH